MKRFKKGAILPLAWPDTTVQCEGVWYDLPMKWVGFIKNDHWSVGHAALLLVDYETGDVKYFDFGRYVAPYKYGRVRGMITDPELEVHTKAIVNSFNEIENIHEILFEISENEGTHGHGRMLVGEYASINYKKALSKIMTMQEKGIIKYSPLNKGASNCSRFVAQVADVVCTNFATKFFIKMPYTISPSPVSNIRVVNNKNYYYEIEHNICSKKELNIFTSFYQNYGKEKLILQY